MVSGVSVIIPSYNEQERIKTPLEKITDYFLKKNIRFEIIVIDDGSTDNTYEMVSRFKDTRFKNLYIYRNTKNMGKGYSIRRGILKSNLDYLLFTDADMSTPITEFDKFLKYLEVGAQVVIGSRKMKGANVIVRQPFVRELFGKIFTGLSNLVLTTNYSDFTCGFKSFEAKAARKIFSLGRINGWSFDAEILFLAKRHNYIVVEVPVKWINDSATKVDLRKDIFSSLLELLKIRFMHIKG